MQMKPGTENSGTENSSVWGSRCTGMNLLRVGDFVELTFIPAMQMKPDIRNFLFAFPLARGEGADSNSQAG